MSPSLGVPSSMIWVLINSTESWTYSTALRRSGLISAVDKSTKVEWNIQTKYHFALILSDILNTYWLRSWSPKHWLVYLFIWTESVQIVQEEGVQKLGHLHHHGWSGGGHHYARVHRVPVMLLVTRYSLLTTTTMADIHEVRSRQNQDEVYLNITSLLQWWVFNTSEPKQIDVGIRIPGKRLCIITSQRTLNAARYTIWETNIYYDSHHQSNRTEEITYLKYIIR